MKQVHIVATKSGPLLKFALLQKKRLKNYEVDFVGTSHSWEGTYGPFKKGDQVKLEVLSTVGDVSGRIYVSRNNEPFVVKAEGTKSREIHFDYTIDY